MSINTPPIKLSNIPKSGFLSAISLTPSTFRMWRQPMGCLSAFV
jgi:hypothetical protein